MAFKGFDLTGKVAVVVGGTSGIGRAITCGLADAGADIVPTSRRREEVEATAADVEARGRKAVRVTSDVTDLASLEAALEATLKALGKVDILVNCAGRTKRQPTLEVSEADWNAILDTNLTGTFEVLPRVRAPHAGEGLRAHRQHRVACRPSSPSSRSRPTRRARPRWRPSPSRSPSSGVPAA